VPIPFVLPQSKQELACGKEKGKEKRTRERKAERKEIKGLSSFIEYHSA
jgi:hypothetical protein